MEFDFDFILDLPVWTVMFYVTVAILVDAALGALKALKKGKFSFEELPRFLGSNVLPYVLGLLLLAVVAEHTTDIFEYVFYVVSLAVFARYVVKLWGKVKGLFGIEF